LIGVIDEVRGRRVVTLTLMSRRGEAVTGGEREAAR
jgi:hypothetical protein